MLKAGIKKNFIKRFHVMQVKKGVQEFRKDL